MRRGAGKSFGGDADHRVRDALRELLKRHEDNQTRLARVLGVSQPAISSILSGKNNTGPELAARIAQELGVSLDALTGGTHGDGVGRWETLPWWEPVVERARALFPNVSANAWIWVGALIAREAPPADPWFLGTLASSWEQATARAATATDPHPATETHVRRKRAK